MIRFLIYALLGFIMYRLVKTVLRIFSASPQQKQTRSNMHGTKKKKSKIDKKDIIEAEFEEINDKEKESSQN